MFKILLVSILMSSMPQMSVLQLQEQYATKQECEAVASQIRISWRLDPNNSHKTMNLIPMCINYNPVVLPDVPFQGGGSCGLCHK